MKGNFQHLDPTSTYIYRENTVVYGFETDCYCFSCDVRNGYLVGKRDSLPDIFGWAIGQHIDTVRDFVRVLKPLYIKGIKANGKH